MLIKDNFILFFSYQPTRTIAKLFIPDAVYLTHLVFPDGREIKEHENIVYENNVLSDATITNTNDTQWYVLHSYSHLTLVTVEFYELFPVKYFDNIVLVTGMKMIIG